MEPLFTLTAAPPMTPIDVTGWTTIPLGTPLAARPRLQCRATSCCPEVGGHYRTR